MKIYRLLLLMLLGIPSFAQTHVFPATDTNNSFTGSNTFSGGGSLSGGWTGIFNQLQNICVADNQTGADMGAKINTCLGKLPLAGMFAGGEVLVTQSGTISTQILINNLSFVTLRCIGADASVRLTNNITGNPSEPAIKVSGTSSYVNIIGCQVFGNGLTGASGNGHGIAVIGTGATPADVNIVNCYINGHQGNGKSGTGASMLAAGIYAYLAIDVRVIGDSSLQSNQYAAFFDQGANNFEVAGDEIVGNLRDGVVAKGLASGWVERNDIEQNGSGTGGTGGTDAGVWFDGVINLHVERNHIEQNNLQQVTSTNSVDASKGVTISGNYGVYNFANGIGFTIASGTEAAIYKNSLIGQALCTGCRFLDVSDGLAYTNLHIYDNNYRQLSGGVSAFMVLFRGATTGAIGNIEGNTCGSKYAATDGTITSCFEVTGPSPNVRLANNQILLNTGATITTGIRIDSGALNTLLENNTFTVLGGTLTNPINDAGTGTVQIQDGIIVTGTGTGNGGNTIRLTADLTLAGNTSLQTIFSWTLPGRMPTQTFKANFHCSLDYSQATAAVADAFGIQSPTAAPTNIRASGIVYTAAGTSTSGTLSTLASTTATNIVTFTPGATATVFTAVIDGQLELPSTATTINVMASQSNASDLVTIKRGSFCALAP